MSKELWFMYFLYWPMAGGYGGWCGQDWSSNWIVWAFLIPPGAWSCYTVLRHRFAAPPTIGSLAAAVLAGLGIGAVTVFIAGMIAEKTSLFWKDPAARAAAGLVMGLAVGGLSALLIRLGSKRQHGESLT